MVTKGIEMQTLVEVAEILKGVAHPLRLKIVELLEQEEMPVKDLQEALGVPQPVVSQQLNVMKAKGIVQSRRQGNSVIYSLANRNVPNILRCIYQHKLGGEE